MTGDVDGDGRLDGLRLRSIQQRIDRGELTWERVALDELTWERVSISEAGSMIGGRLGARRSRTCARRSSPSGRRAPKSGT